MLLEIEGCGEAQSPMPVGKASDDMDRVPISGYNEKVKITSAKIR